MKILVSHQNAWTKSMTGGQVFYSEKKALHYVEMLKKDSQFGKFYEKADFVFSYWKGQKCLKTTIVVGKVGKKSLRIPL